MLPRNIVRVLAFIAFFAFSIIRLFCSCRVEIHQILSPGDRNQDEKSPVSVLQLLTCFLWAFITSSFYCDKNVAAWVAVVRLTGNRSQTASFLLYRLHCNSHATVMTLSSGWRYVLSASCKDRKIDIIHIPAAFNHCVVLACLVLFLLFFHGDAVCDFGLSLAYIRLQINIYCICIYSIYCMYVYMTYCSIS